MASHDTSAEASLAKLPPSALLIYRVLREIEPATKQDLANESLLNPSTTAYALDRLDEAGFIGSKPSPADARQRIYWISVQI